MATKEKDRIMLISINRRLDDIFNGKKLWEYRRVPPSTENELLTIVYDSGKSKAIVGEFWIDGILRKPVELLISQTIHETTSTESGLRDYFSGLELGSALRVKDPHRYESSMSLRKIREVVPNFMPPQNFIYLRRGDERTGRFFDSIIRLRKAEIS